MRMRDTSGPRPWTLGGLGLAALAGAACDDSTAPMLESGAVASINLPPRTPSGKKTCRGFVVDVGARTFRGKVKATVPASQVAATITVRGRHVEFDVAANTFAVRNYFLTGAPAEIPITNQRTRIFVSKVPQHGDNLNQALRLDMNNEQLVLERAGARQDMKIQAKDCNQGGIFQMEPEPATVEVNTLASPFTFFRRDPVSGRVFFTNQTTVLGYDSPQAAVLLSRTGTVTRWRVNSGGRIGMVLGEDAFEALDEAQ